MGMYKQENCVFTGLPAISVMDDKDEIDYWVEVEGKRHFIRLPYYANQWVQDNEFFKANKNIFLGLLHNNNWFEDEKNTYITIDELKGLLKRKSFPKSPEEKIENLFLKLVSFQKEDGEWITLDKDFYDNILWKVLYFKSVSELNYYVEALEDSGRIEVEYNQTIDRGGLLDAYRITFEGLNYFIKVSTKGDDSKKCFVAMSFRPETRDIRQAIKDAIEQTGFDPILIDEQHIESDKTINDEIISNLKKCRFCIADFTFHSNGVYFESGFALGQGKKVIYTCRQDEFASAHFDIRPLQHIVYSDSIDLKTRLVSKIEAWIS